MALLTHEQAINEARQLIVELVDENLADCNETKKTLFPWMLSTIIDYLSSRNGYAIMLIKWLAIPLSIFVFFIGIRMFYRAYLESYDRCNKLKETAKAISLDDYSETLIEFYDNHRAFFSSNPINTTFLESYLSKLFKNDRVKIAELNVELAKLQTKRAVKRNEVRKNSGLRISYVYEPIKDMFDVLDTFINEQFVFMLLPDKNAPNLNIWMPLSSRALNDCACKAMLLQLNENERIETVFDLENHFRQKIAKLVEKSYECYGMERTIEVASELGSTYLISNATTTDMLTEAIFELDVVQRLLRQTPLEREPLSDREKCELLNDLRTLTFEEQVIMIANVDDCGI